MKMKSSFVAALLMLGGAHGAAAAAENPADYAGIGHNLYLNCLLGTDSSGIDMLIDVVEKCGYDPGIPLDEYVKQYGENLELDPRPLSEVVAPDRDQYSDYEFSFFERIDETVASSADLHEAGAKFEALEDEAIAKLDPKSAAGERILSGLSVARHTTANWLVLQPNQARREPTKREWIIIAYQDISTWINRHDLGAAASASKHAYDHFSHSLVKD